MYIPISIRKTMFGKQNKMKKHYLYSCIILLLGICFGQIVIAQDFRGIVYELESSNPLWNVTVRNVRTQQEANTDREGRFNIKAQLNDYLTFTLPGYQTDTVFIYEEGVRRVYMLQDEERIVMDEILVSRMTDSRLTIEIAKARNEGKAVEASQQRGGLRVSPSRVFGRKAKQARSTLALLLEEQNNRKIDRIFTSRLIISVVTLNEDELALFRERFRPTLKFAESASPEDMRAYILDSYKKFKEEK